MTVVQMVRYSASYKGAWIYQVIPLPGKGLVYRGMLKAAVVKLLVPLFLLEAAVFIALLGSWIIADMVVVLLALLLYAVICFLTFPKRSRSRRSMRRRSGRNSPAAPLSSCSFWGACRITLCLHPDSCRNIHLHGNSGSCECLDLAQGLPAGRLPGQRISNPPRRRLRTNMDNFCRRSKKGPSSIIYLDSPVNTG